MKQVRRQRSSTPRPQRVPKKGGLARSFGLLKCGQEESKVAIGTSWLIRWGFLLSVVVHPADIQDRDGAFQLLCRARRLFPFIKRIFADGGYAGEKMALWSGAPGLEAADRERSDAAGFEVLPKRCSSKGSLHGSVAIVAWRGL